MDFVEVARIEDVPLGRMRAFTVGERKIALYHTADGFFATDNTCPHRGGPLAEGDLIGGEVTCPWHLWGFDVQSGVCTGNASVRVTAHTVRVENGRVLVSLS
jgi:nitrite reductase (NADH) small subunit